MNKIIGFIGVVVIGLGVVGCDRNSSNNDIIGTWVGSFSDKAITVEITKSRWSLLAFNRYNNYGRRAGTYIKSGDNWSIQ